MEPAIVGKISRDHDDGDEVDEGDEDQSRKGQKSGTISCDSTGPFFIHLEYLDANKMMDKVEISIWNIWMWRKWEAKFRNP